MKVIIDIAEVARGGMERQVIQLASGLQHRGHGDPHRCPEACIGLPRGDR